MSIADGASGAILEPCDNQGQLHQTVLRQKSSSRQTEMASVHGSKVKEPRLIMRSGVPMDKQAPYTAGKERLTV